MGSILIQCIPDNSNLNLSRSLTYPNLVAIENAQMGYFKWFEFSRKRVTVFELSGTHCILLARRVQVRAHQNPNTNITHKIGTVNRDLEMLYLKIGITDLCSLALKKLFRGT